MKARALKAGLALVALLATALACEVVLRWTMPAPQAMWQIGGLFQIDEQLIYSLRAGVGRTWTTDEFTEVARTNALGLRDDEVEKPVPGTTRIIILGDSMTFGHGVANDEAYPNQLERIFQAGGRRVDVINAGVKGYGTDQSYRLFTSRLMVLAPQVVIVGVYWNDVGDNVKQPLYAIHDGTLVPLDARAHPIYRLGYLDQRAPSWLRHTFLYNAAMQGLRVYGGWSAYLAQSEDTAKLKIRLEVQDLVRLGRDRGFRVVQIGVPYGDRPPGAYRFLSDSPVEGALNEDLSTRPVWQDQRDRLFFRNDPHFTREGHHVLADQLHELLVRAGI